MHWFMQPSLTNLACTVLKSRQLELLEVLEEHQQQEQKEPEGPQSIHHLARYRSIVSRKPFARNMP